MNPFPPELNEEIGNYLNCEDLSELVKSNFFNNNTKGAGADYVYRKKCRPSSYAVIVKNLSENLDERKRIMRLVFAGLQQCFFGPMHFVSMFIEELRKGLDPNNAFNFINFGLHSVRLTSFLNMLTTTEADDLANHIINDSTVDILDAMFSPWDRSNYNTPLLDRPLWVDIDDDNKYPYVKAPTMEMYTKARLIAFSNKKTNTYFKVLSRSYREDTDDQKKGWNGQIHDTFILHSGEAVQSIIDRFQIWFHELVFRLSLPQANKYQENLVRKKFEEDGYDEDDFDESDYFDDEFIIMYKICEAEKLNDDAWLATIRRSSEGSAIKETIVIEETNLPFQLILSDARSLNLCPEVQDYKFTCNKLFGESYKALLAERDMIEERFKNNKYERNRALSAWFEKMKRDKDKRKLFLSTHSDKWRSNPNLLPYAECEGFRDSCFQNLNI